MRPVEYAMERKEELLNRTDNEVVDWLLRTVPASLFIPQYWIGLGTGIIIGVLYGGGWLAA